MLVPASPSPRKKRKLSPETLGVISGAKRLEKLPSRGNWRNDPKPRTEQDRSPAGSSVADPVSSTSNFLQGLKQIQAINKDSEGRKRSQTTRSRSFADPNLKTVAMTNRKKHTTVPDHPNLSIRNLSGIGKRLIGTSVAKKVLPSTDQDFSKRPFRNVNDDRDRKYDERTREEAGDHQNDDEDDDDLDILDAPKGPKTRDRDGKVIEPLSLGPISHPSIPGDPNYETFEPYSRIHLRPGSRRIPHKDLQHHFTDRYHLSPSLLYSRARQQSAKGEIEVAVDADFIVVGVLAHKGPINVTNPNAKESTKERKNIRFTLVDLSTPEASSTGHGVLSVMLFEAEHVDTRVEADGYERPMYKGGSGGAYEKFWKESVGAVVAILNPRILKQVKDSPHKNIYTLVPENAESMMVIGRSRDFRSCTAKKADETICGDWCDARVNEYCHWHVQRAIQYTSVRRPETSNVNSSMAVTTTFNPTRFERNMLRGGANSTKRLGSNKNGYNPEKKIGLLPRDHGLGTSLQDGVKTYVTKSGGTNNSINPNVRPSGSSTTSNGLNRGRMTPGFTAADLRRAAIDSGNGSGGYIKGVRDGPTLVELEKARARKLAEKESSERDLLFLLEQDGGRTVGGDYLTRRAKIEGKQTSKARKDRLGTADGGGGGGGGDDDAEEDERTENEKQRKKRLEARAFSTRAVRLIGYDPTRMDGEEEDPAEREKMKNLDKLLSKPIEDRQSSQSQTRATRTTSKPKKTSIPSTGKPSTGITTSLPPSLRSNKQEDAIKGEEEADADVDDDDDDDDLLIEGGPEDLK